MKIRRNNSLGSARSRKSGNQAVLAAVGGMFLLFTGSTLLTYHRVASFPATPTVAEEAPDTADPITKLQHTFPIHVGDDMEEISHPGLDMAGPNAKVPRDLAHTLSVPRFWDDLKGSAYGHETVRQFLGDGDRLPTPEEAQAIGSFWQGHETIYVSVASYRDPECTGTVEDIFARAEFPDRIRVAILDQRTDGDPICQQPAESCDSNPNQALCRYRHLIDAYELDARLAVGPVFARHLAHRFYRGEYFAAQVDSHVRFVQNWDTIIVDHWKTARNEMAVLSTYLSDIIGRIDPVTHAMTNPGRPIMCNSDFEGEGVHRHLRHGQQPEGVSGIHGEPTLHPFWAAGFSFARGHFVIQVPYDQYLPMIFQGEEISMGLRGFTYGYDYYAPEFGVCYHMYAIKENEEKRKRVPLFWENTNVYQGVGKQAMMRLNAIIGVAEYPENQWPHEQVHKYGLGKIRKTSRFFEIFGIHVREQRVEHHLCRFVGKPMMRVFQPALRENRMGLDYDKIDYVFKDPAPDEAPR